MALASLVSKQKGQSLLRKLIEQELIEHKETPWLKEGDWVRSSSVHGLCAREEVLAALLEVVRKEKINASLSLIFAHGNALHHQLQNDILPRLGVLLGQWRCNWCMKRHGGWSKKYPPERTLVRRPKKCRRCGQSSLTYSELMFEDEALHINGHPDGFLQIPGLPGLGILEAKSIGMRGGPEIRRTPNVSHVLQAQTYMMLTGLRWAKILYWQKAENGLDALVEHLVEYDQETIDAIREMVQSIWIGIKRKELPDRICETQTCNRAKECALVKQCFEYNKTIL